MEFIAEEKEEEERSITQHGASETLYNRKDLYTIFILALINILMINILNQAENSPSLSLTHTLNDLSK